MKELQKLQSETVTGMKEKNAVLQLKQSQQLEKIKKEKLKLEETLQVTKYGGNQLCFDILILF